MRSKVSSQQVIGSTSIFCWLAYLFLMVTKILSVTSLRGCQIDVVIHHWLKTIINHHIYQ